MSNILTDQPDGGGGQGGLSGIEAVLHCCACSRIFKLPQGSGPGSVVNCPFCHTQQKLRLITVYVSDPLVRA